MFDLPPSSSEDGVGGRFTPVANRTKRFVGLTKEDVEDISPTGKAARGVMGGGGEGATNNRKSMTMHMHMGVTQNIRITLQASDGRLEKWDDSLTTM